MNCAEKDGDADEPPPKRSTRTEAAKKKGKGSTQKGSSIIISGAHKPNKQLSDVSEKVATSKSTSPSLAEQSNPVTTLEGTHSSSKTQTNTNASLELVQHEGQLSLEQPQISRVIADNPSSDSKSSPQMQPQDGEEKENDRSNDYSVDGESLVFTYMHSLTYTCTVMCTIVLHSMTSIPDFAAELLLNMMVDDNCSRLDYLEAELVKLQAAG